MKRLRKTTIVSILAMLVLSILPSIPPVLASPATVCKVHPKNYIYDTSIKTVGDRFNVTVWVEDMDDMKCWQVVMYYNDTIINVTRYWDPFALKWKDGRWFEPTWDSNYVFFTRVTSPVPYPPEVKYVSAGPHNGSVGIGCCLTPAPPAGGGYTGDGLLCIIEFEITLVPKRQTVNCTLDIDTKKTFWIKAGEAVKRYFDTYTNGYYENTWKEPKKPDLAVRGPAGETELKFGPFPPPANCTEFWVGAWVENLDGGWGLTGANFCLCFDNSLINVTAASPGPLWTTSSTTPLPISDGEICANVSDPSTTPVSGNVLLLNVTFHIIYQNTIPPATLGDYNDTYIDFCEYTLIDPPSATVPVKSVIPCHVIIYALTTVPLPWLEVVDPKDGDHEVVMGPEPAVCKEFEVDVVIKNLHPSAEMIGYNFRVCYCDIDFGGYLDNISITEGPFLKDPRWCGPAGTIFIGRFDRPIYPYPECAVVGGIYWPPYGPTFPCAEGPDVNCTALGYDPPPDPVLCTITFHVSKQLTAWPPINLTCDLKIMDACDPPSNRYFLDKDKQWIPNATHVDGIVTIVSTPAIGKVIDVYGGVECTPYPPGYGGQGQGEPMDMIWPQKEVCLCANVTYNYWPVQDKVVGFEIEGPYLINIENVTYVDLTDPRCSQWHVIWPPCSFCEEYHLKDWKDNEDGVLSTCDDILLRNKETGDEEWFHVDWMDWDGDDLAMGIRPTVMPPRDGAFFIHKDTAMTDKDGVACISFRMPWQGCEEPERYFGIYRVTVTVDIACECICDRTYFHYDYLVRIFDVTTDKYYYEHTEDVVITVKYGTHMMQRIHPALFWVFIKDELNVPIGHDFEELGTIGGATFCKYKSGWFKAYIHIPKWAYAGRAYIHVNCFDKDPTEGGCAWCPEYTCPPHQPGLEPYPTIYILPK